MPKGTCCVDGCDRPVYVREMCTLHYQRFRANGDPLVVMKSGGARHKKDPAPCAVDGCTSMAKSLGWCVKHYTRYRIHGDPFVTSRIVGDLEARWWSKVDRRGDHGCWPWTDAPSSDGYGVFGIGQKVVKAHRWGYERFVEPIPAGLMPDHLCHDPAVCKLDKACPHRLCVNFLNHLRVVTNRENVLRGQSAKLSDDAVLSLYRRWQAGEVQRVLADEAGVNRVTLIRRFRLLEANLAA